MILLDLQVYGGSTKMLIKKLAQYPKDSVEPIILHVVIKYDFKKL